MEGQINSDLKEYKSIETRLYGELLKTCRRYSNELNLISILGILEIIKQEIKDLDKTDKILMKDEVYGEKIPVAEDEKHLDSLI